MRCVMVVMLGICWTVSSVVDATSFGRRDVGNIVAINARPAICLPNNAKRGFAVGWFSLTESYRRNPRSWGASLLPGFNPLELSPGACFAFGNVPEGYKLNDFKNNEPLQALEVNRTYVFSLSNADHPTDTYEAIFCVEQTATGAVEFLQYTLLADGSQAAPSCGGKHNADAATPTDRGDINQ
jgi:hypothetical protein